MRTLLCLFAIVALFCAVEQSAALPESLFPATDEIVPEAGAVQESDSGMQLLQQIDMTNAALDKAFDEAISSVDDSDEQREMIEEQTASIQEEAPVVKAKAAPTNTYGWWEVNQIQLKAKHASSCITDPKPEYTVAAMEAPSTENSRQHFSDLCADEISVKNAKTKKEKAFKESKTKSCEKAGKSASSASEKSKKLNAKLESSFKEAKELKKKLSDSSKENEKKLEDKTNESEKKLEKKSGEAKKKHAAEAETKKVAIEAHSKKMSQMANEVVFKKDNMSDSTREKIFKGWKKHLKKEKAVKHADVQRKLAEEKKCKADDAEKKTKGKNSEANKKKAAEVASKKSVGEEKDIKSDALKKAKEACKKGEVSESQKSFEKQSKISAEQVQKAAVAEERGIKERAEKAATPEEKPKPKPEKKKPKHSEKTHKNRVKETVTKMRHLRTALEGANELYAKTTSGDSEKKEKCKAAVQASEKKLEAQKERVKKANETAKKELAKKQAEQQKEKEAKAAEAADPYNQAELISKSVLKMKAMYHSEKEREGKTIKATKEACDKKYKKLENEGHSKEKESKRKMNQLNSTMHATIEKAEKTQCQATLKESEVSNKAEEKFWQAKVAELNANIGKAQQQGTDATKHAVFDVCAAAAEDVVSAMAKSSASVFKNSERED